MIEHGTRNAFMIFIVALLVRVMPVAVGNQLGGRLEYDDGVYFSAAVNLVHGAWPYTDFTFVHPPGVILVLLPFATIARILHDDTLAISLARIAFCAIGATNAVLVHNYLARHGYRSAMAAGMFYAVWRIPAITEHTAMLEPLLSLSFLISLRLLDRPTQSRTFLAMAGIVASMGFAVKLWGIVALLALLAYAIYRFRWTGAIWFGMLGVAFPVAVTCSALMFLTKGAIFEMTVTAQLHRSSPDGLLDRINRFADLSGLYGFTQFIYSIPRIFIAVPCIAILCYVCATAAFGESRQRLIAGLAILQCIMVASGPTYWYHYFAFTAPLIALVLGMVSLPSVIPSSLRAGGRPLALAALLTLAVSSVSNAIPGPTRPTLSSFEVNPECVWFVDPSEAISANRLTRNVARKCPALADPYGTLMAMGSDVSYDFVSSARESKNLQTLYLNQIMGSDALILPPRETSPLSGATYGRIEGMFGMVSSQEGAEIWVKK